jgi:hypothetical protein
MQLTVRALPCLLLAALAACLSSAHAQPGMPISWLLPTDEGLLGQWLPSSPQPGPVYVAAAAAADDAPVTCPAGVEPGNPDFGKGQFSQGVSYAIPMMQVCDYSRTWGVARFSSAAPHLHLDL